MEILMHTEVQVHLLVLVDFANITAKTPTVVFCMSFNAKGLTVSQKRW